MSAEGTTEVLVQPSLRDFERRVRCEPSPKGLGYSRAVPMARIDPFAGFERHVLKRWAKLERAYGTCDSRRNTGDWDWGLATGDR